MTVVFLILKIIGILLLILLGLLVFLIVSVLFFPIRYRAVGSYHDSQLLLKVRVSWFAHLLLLAYDLLPENNCMYLRICGIKKTMEKGNSIPNSEDTTEETAEEDSGSIEETEESADREFVGNAVEQEKKEAPVEKSSFWKNWKQKIQGIVSKIKATVNKLKHAFRNLTATIARIRELLSDDRNKEALHFLGNKLFFVLKRISPRKLKLDSTFSTGSPDTTGEVLGILALFPIGYQNRWHITPDFTADQFYVEADFDIRGRIYLYQIVGAALGILLDKNCRRLYNQIIH